MRTQITVVYDLLIKSLNIEEATATLRICIVNTKESVFGKNS